MSEFPNYQAWLDLLAARRDAPILWIAVAALVVVVWLYNLRTFPRPMLLVRFGLFVLFIIGIAIPLIQKI